MLAVSTSLPVRYNNIVTISIVYRRYKSIGVKYLANFSTECFEMIVVATVPESFVSVCVIFVGWFGAWTRTRFHPVVIIRWYSVAVKTFGFSPRRWLSARQFENEFINGNATVLSNRTKVSLAKIHNVRLSLAVDVTMMTCVCILK